MIIVRLSGGLGNQLFQYALGRAMSLKNNSELVLDLSSYSNQKPDEAFRVYTLDKFNVQGRLAKPADFRALGIPDPSDNDFFARARRAAIRKIEARKPIEKRKIILEPDFSFEPAVLEARGDHFLSGVWQSERYFKDAEQQIRQELTLKQPFSAEAEKLRRMMAESTSVSVHIRRGDQVSDPKLVMKHGLLGDDYYTSALEHIRAKKGREAGPVRTFIFSDDIAWVKAHMNLGTDAVFVSSYGLPDYEELMLIASCRHNIVAKSSFSWWGAWLNANPNKIVIAPKYRFRVTVEEHDKDLYPESWILL